ncbi:MAG: DUF5666 domain-containing protein, partial [Burkholderiaceae bacterium]
GGGGGGSGGGGSGGGGTPIAASTGLGVGTVTGFGSIVVDGIRYDDSKARIELDTEAGAPDASSRSIALKLGQRVEIEFSGSETNSSASAVRISAEIVGTVTAIAPDLVVAGQIVKINTNSALGPVTVFEGFASAADILVGDRIEVHAIPLAAGTVQATRIERKPKTSSWLRITGSVTALAANGSSFLLGGLTVNVAAATRIVPTGATLADGQRVVVWTNSAAVANSVTAATIRIKGVPQAGTSEMRLAGAVTDCTPPCEGNFKVAGIGVDATNAEFKNGTKANLSNGKWVELRGSVNPSGIYVATRVKFRHDDDDENDASLRGAVTDFVSMTNFKVRGVLVTTNGATQIGASCPSPLADTTLVQVKGSFVGLAVLARSITCFSSADGVTLEAKGTIATIDLAAKTFTLGAELAGITLQWTDTTEFPLNRTSADLQAGLRVHVKGNVAGSVLTVTRIRFDDDFVRPPGVALFETEGVASKVTKLAEVVTGLTVNGLAITVNAQTKIVVQGGLLVDGARVEVVFKKEGGANVALLVRTDD